MQTIKRRLVTINHLIKMYHQTHWNTKPVTLQRKHTAAAIFLYWLTEYGSQFNSVWMIVFSFQTATSILGTNANDAHCLLVCDKKYCWLHNQNSYSVKFQGQLITSITAHWVFHFDFFLSFPPRSMLHIHLANYSEGRKSISQAT